LNPADNHLFAAWRGVFKMKASRANQYGAAWWFLDQENGIRAHSMRFRTWAC